MSRHKNKNKKTHKKWRYVYRKFGITQRFKIEDTKDQSYDKTQMSDQSDESEKRLHMERLYEGSQILFLESRAQSMALQICISFLPFIVDLTFGKILNIYEKSHSRYLNSQLRIQIVWLTCKRFHFCKCPGECPLKNTEQMTWKKLVITLIYKLKLNTSVN